MQDIIVVGVEIAIVPLDEMDIEEAVEKGSVGEEEILTVGVDEKIIEVVDEVVAKIIQ